MKKAVFLLILSINLVLNLCINAQCDRQRDSLALEAFFFSTVGTDWQNKTNWTIPGRPISTWFGVTLSSEGCVESLRLLNNKLSGGLPPELGELSELKILNLTSNNISGNLPATITNLTQLEELILNNNFLNGWLPGNIGLLSNLRILRLSVNRFSGDLPPSLGNISGLTSLLLNQNLFSGSIPASIGNLINLEELVLSQNDLTGALPASVSNLSKLRTLILSQNKLSGSIPISYGSLPSLRTMSLDENRLTGVIPASLGNNLEFRELYLQNNQLTGIIPIELTKLSELQKLLANNNNLSGNIPFGFGDLKKLISLHLSENQLTGSIPEDLGNAQNLISLILSDNNLDGPIPETIGNLANLDILQLQNNRLSGELPETLGNLTKLRRLYFFNNRLEGCFPTTMQRFCPTVFSTNVSTNGHNFMENSDLVHGGDFKRWCAGEGRPMISITGDSILCEGSILQLTATGGDFYSWSGPGSFSSNQASIIINAPTISEFGSYRVTVTNTNKCTGTRNVNIRPVNVVNVSSNAPVCEGEVLRFFASGGVSYKWFGPGGYYSEEQNPVRPIGNFTMAGTYRVEIVTEACVVTRNLEIAFVSFGEIISNSPVCEGNQLNLDVTEGVSFNWKGPDGFESNLKNPFIQNFSSRNSGIYTVTIRATDNCITTLSIEINVTEKLIPVLDSFPVLCSYSDPIELPFIQDGIDGRWIGVNISDENGIQQFSPILSSGNIPISFEPTDKSACVGIANTEIFVSTLDISVDEKQSSFNESDDNGIALITINSDSRNNTLIWEGNGTGSKKTSEESSVEINNLKSGIYSFQITDEWGCMAFDTVIIRYLKPYFFLPNVIAQNATDPDNNTFYLKGQNILSYKYDIYNRWGNIIATKENAAINNPEDGWNVKSSNITSGVYIFVMSIRGIFEDYQISGSITVL